MASDQVQYDIQTISCPSDTLCVAVGPVEMATSDNPTTGTWTITQTPAAWGSLDQLSCPSVTFCAAGGTGGTAGDGYALTRTDPTGGAKAWTQTLADPISCTATPTICANE